MDAKMKTVGSKAEVFHGSAKHTSGGLHKKDLMKHKGRIVSRKKHAAGKKAIQRLFKLGYKPTKGTFKAMRKGVGKTRRSRGGAAPAYSGNGSVADTLANLGIASTGSAAGSMLSSLTGSK